MLRPDRGRLAGNGKTASTIRPGRAASGRIFPWRAQTGSIELSVAGIDRDPTLRSLTDRLVGQLEMWITSLEGGTVMPRGGNATPDGWRSRLEAAGPRFRELVLAPIRDGRADETFVDAMCDPPETFTYAGVLAHVLTFSAVRRTMAIGALESAGIADLGSGDPMRFVGGSGADASMIRRHRG